jgi:acetyl-CoA decarbonylase/synthase complex subunit beta
MAGQTGGGKQVVGFLGVGVNYFRSPKFIQADGGWNRVVWMPKMLKEKIFQDIPEGIREKIATEDDAKDIDSLRNFLKEKSHPILERWVEEEAEEEIEEEAPAKAQATSQTGFAAPQMMQMPTNFMPSMPMMGGGSGGVRIILKNAKVTVDKITILKED